MPLPFEGDPALLGRLLAGISEVDQERRRRQDRKQERSLLVAVPAVFGTLQQGSEHERASTRRKEKISSATYLKQC